MGDRTTQNEDRVFDADNAVASLYAQEAAGLIRFLTGVLRDSERACDVAQIAFAKLLEQSDQVEAGSRRAWLYQVAMREALDQKRRQERAGRAREQFFWLRAARGGRGAGDGEDVVERAEEIERVRMGLARLPPEQRQVVRMKIYDGRTFSQIADELQIPLGTALSRMRAALAKLRSWLEDESGGE